MDIRSWIINLHKKKIISKKPEPAIPFLIFLIALLLGVYSPEPFSYFFMILAIIALIFSILHLLVYLILEKKL